METTTNELTLTDVSASAVSGCSCGGCGCGDEADATATAAPADAAEPTAITEKFLVSGMTCGHCVASVTEELSALSGVASVSVALEAGGASVVTVDSATPLDRDAVRTAVEEAGYGLVTSAP